MVTDEPGDPLQVVGDGVYSKVTLLEMLEPGARVRALFDVARAAHPDDLVASEQPPVTLNIGRAHDR